MGINAMFLDACAIIYLIEANDEKSNRIRQLANALSRGVKFVSADKDLVKEVEVEIILL
jgi:hypothetical protein